MTIIKTEFSPGDTIFFLSSWNKVVSEVVAEIKIRVKRSNDNTDWENEITYFVQDHDGLLPVNGKDAFKTKQDLLNSL